MTRKISVSRIVFIYVIFLGIFRPSFAQEGSTSNRLGIGDLPPPIKVAKWLKGDPVSDFRKGHIYVVEFGFTTCAPCIAGIPHLTNLANQYKKEVTVISVFVKDHISKVESLMEKIGKKMGYAVAIDNSDGAMDTNWVKKSGNTGYPAIFLIDQNGKIAWIGHDTHILNQYVAQLLDGNVDLNIAEQVQQQQSKIFNRILQSKDYVTALSCIDSLVQANPQKKYYKILKFQTLLKADENKAYQYGWDVLLNEPWELYESGLYKTAALLFDISKLKMPDYDLAIAMNKKVIDSSPVEYVVASAYKQISWAYFLKGNPKKGEKMMMKAIENIPKIPEADQIKESWLDQLKQLNESSIRVGD